MDGLFRGNTILSILFEMNNIYIAMVVSFIPLFCQTWSADWWNLFAKWWEDACIVFYFLDNSIISSDKTSPFRNCDL